MAIGDFETRNPRVSIVIRCFNEVAHIGRLLAGVEHQSVDDVEVVIVDSGSTDGTVSVASLYPTKIISIQPEDFSFGYALNVGCKAAKGEILLFASAHVYPVRTDWVQKMIAPFADDSVGIVYGRQQGNEITKYSEHQIFQKWFPVQSDYDQEHFFCNNANTAIRRELWERFRYDESLTGLEDLDMGKKLKAAGYKVAYEAAASVVHVHDEGYRRILNRYRREAIALKNILPHEHFNLLDFFRLYTANTFTDLVHAWRDGVLSRSMPSIMVFRLMQFWGTYRGFSQHGVVSESLKHRFYYPKGLTQSRNEVDAEHAGKVIDYSAVEDEKR